MTTPRKKYSPTFKAKIVRELLKEEQTLSQIAAAASVIVLTALEQSLNPHPQVKAIITKPFDIERLLILVENI